MIPEIISLDGEWDFFYSPQKFEAGQTLLPDSKLYTGKIRTPGYWDDQYELFDEEDFFGLTARFNPDYRKPHFPMGRSLTPHASSSFLIGSGYYRKKISADFAPGSQIVLTVGPAMWGCCVYCNQQFAGKVTGYSTASDFDLSNLMMPHTDNELIIVVCNVHDDGGAFHRVDKTHDGIAFGTRPGQHRGLAAQGYQAERAGIGGGVSLKITGNARIADYFISFENEVPHWHVELVHGTHTQLVWEISRNGKILYSGMVPCHADQIDFTTPEAILDRWSDRTPELYDVRLTLLQDAKPVDSVVWQWAPCTVVCRGTSILVNGDPTYFRGVTEHCYFPETCNPHFDKQQYLHDLKILKNAGFNFIRCHTWCPPEPFYDACDELGLFVQTEFPSVYTFEEARAIIRQVRKHTCAVILCEGNEKCICEKGIERLRTVAAILHEMAPGMLFNPQEAIRGVEYDFAPGQKTTAYPYEHDAERLAALASFSDLYGSLGNGYFSYFHDQFPGVEKVMEEHTIYQKPCLSHEIGILGGYLDFDLENRYKGTFIGTDLFEAAREHMQKHGVYQYRKEYYELNCRFISSIRKQLMENIRQCPCITGSDYLGGIDTHWHLVGYPCGILNEFYEEKYGETIADVRRYNDETVVLCSAGNRRNRRQGTTFSEEIRLSYYGKGALDRGTLNWSFEINGQCVAGGCKTFSGIAPGSVTAIGQVEFELPTDTTARCGILRCEVESAGKTWENHWKFWVFPAAAPAEYSNVRCADRLTPDLIKFMEDGGAVFLTDHFPGATLRENFRPHTSGRSIGHSGARLHAHPIWRDFPNETFADWQFFSMMKDSKSLIFDKSMPEFAPILELIPSFKMVKRKTLLAEYAVGKGRLMICGLNLQESDPAAVWMKHILLKYLASQDHIQVPAWNAGQLRQTFEAIPETIERAGKKIDAGGRPIDD